MMKSSPDLARRDAAVAVAIEVLELTEDLLWNAFKFEKLPDEHLIMGGGLRMALRMALRGTFRAAIRVAISGIGNLIQRSMVDLHAPMAIASAALALSGPGRAPAGARRAEPGEVVQKGACGAPRGRRAP